MRWAAIVSIQASEPGKGLLCHAPNSAWKGLWARQSSGLPPILPASELLYQASIRFMTRCQAIGLTADQNGAIRNPIGVTLSTQTGTPPGIYALTMEGVTSRKKAIGYIKLLAP